jgi:hypothetical protein
MALPQKDATSGEPHPSAVERNVISRRAAYKAENTRAARGALVEALIAHAEAELSLGHEAATVAALAEAGSLFPGRLSGEAMWRGRFVMLNRTKGALAQRQDRQADAVEAFEAALSVIPAHSEDIGRDDAAARLQLLVRLARSRLALHQAEAVADEMRECEALMAALAGKIPARAIEAIRAAVLGNSGVAEAMLGHAQAAEAKLAESVAVIDRVAAPELADLRRQVLSAWSEVIRRGGGDPSAIVARDAHTDPAHEGACGCGNPDPHDRGHCSSPDRDEHHHGHPHQHPHGDHHASRHESGHAHRR